MRGDTRMDSKICKYCKKEIKDRDELVTASNWFRVRPFHYRCFQKLEQETSAMWLAWTPVNGPSGNVTVLLMLVLAIWMLVTNTLGLIGDLIGILALYPILLRLISLFSIENKIPKVKK